MRCLTVGLAVILAASDGSSAAAQRRAAPPDIVLVGGKVFTADSARPWAEAVGIRDGRIVAVGTTQAIRALAGPKSRVIDVGGRVIVPGFNDAHDHVSGGSPGTFVLDSSPIEQRSIALLLDSLRAAADGLRCTTFRSAPGR